MGNLKREKTGKPSFEESLKSLEELLDRLENPSLPLDELIVSYESARKRLEECRKLLDEAELKVKTLSKNGAEEPFDSDE
ncbi:MAG: exodeoxyribonuclease VII small subunit [Verrucomicrobia bacterium]|nr:MAG: exodeoxyribonuclease VII small subunit [Verrucomicrobiota bacterium]